MNGPTERERYGVENGWLFEYVNEHTCGTGTRGHYGAHEPGCGTVPIGQVEDLLRESARVAVLERQIAAIEALADEVEAQARMADESIPDATVSIGAIWDALAAGVDPKGSMVVDNPTEGMPHA